MPRRFCGERAPRAPQGTDITVMASPDSISAVGTELTKTLAVKVSTFAMTALSAS